jgi:hypothetical protein
VWRGRNRLTAEDLIVLLGSNAVRPRVEGARVTSPLEVSRLVKLLALQGPEGSRGDRGAGGDALCATLFAGGAGGAGGMLEVLGGCWRCAGGALEVRWRCGGARSDAEAWRHGALEICCGPGRQYGVRL